MADTDDTVTISRKEYDQLQKDADMLCALEACGVDNWEGYSEAHRYLRVASRREVGLRAPEGRLGVYGPRRP